MSTMIEGLHADVQGVELADLMRRQADRLDQKAKHHRGEAERERTPERVAAIREQDKMGMSRQQAPWEYHEERAKKHEREAARLRFLADHTEKATMYRLSERDLEVIGAVPTG